MLLTGYNNGMNRKKPGVKTITFDIGPNLKEFFDGYCERRSLTLAEVLRCFVANLPADGASTDVRAELVALRDKLQKRIDELP